MPVFIEKENIQCYMKQLLHEKVTYNYCWRVKIFTWKVQAEGRKASKKDWGQRQSWRETHPVVAWFASHCINYCHSSCSKGRLPAPILILGHKASQFPWAGYRARRVDIDAVNKINDQGVKSHLKNVIIIRKLSKNRSAHISKGANLNWDISY